ncbi:PLD nuclease N-terminal domain-containing protein [Rhodococcus sp. (in: high G+C Gram-positive bacteria)]|uniref:PLD nuclease N-terminal domain-containing protein n=1 Tax=unclassified Rhodococcus (in: high G+C Gram-positive bacteria) TaxID=192944 RepID=UPI001A0DC19D|nr:PLD nuclease N-terminal domain-containing protein [Rhodococcus sp. (in: high G+C Gram-positive bacteria)]MBF0660023.1 PLDc_N domain-containing protein [Rhodococcus sp. (in: high G+C Gram-positive bacteria)]
MPYFGLIVMIVWVACLIDVIRADEHEVRHLPKPLWLMVVILLPLVGSVLWLLVGRPDGVDRSRTQRPASAFPEYNRPGRQAGQQPETDEEFLRRCRERAEQQRRVAREQEKRRLEREGGAGA